MGRTKRLTGPSSFALTISPIIMGIYIRYRQMMPISSGSQANHSLECTAPNRPGPPIHIMTVQAYQKPASIMPTMEDLMAKLF